MTPLRRLLLKDLLILMGAGLLAAGLGIGWLWYRTLTTQAEREARTGLHTLHGDLNDAFRQVEAAGRILERDWQAGHLDPRRPAVAEARIHAVLRQLPLAGGAVLYLPLEGGFLANPSNLKIPSKDRTYATFLVGAAGEGTPQIRMLRNQDQLLAQPGPPKTLGMAPTGRPWYRQALTQTGPGWAAPYPFHESESSGGLTFVVPLRGSKGELKGVLGVDLLFDDLRNRIDAIRPTPGSLVAITDDQGRALLTPRGPAQRMGFLQPVGPDHLPLFHALPGAGEGEDVRPLSSGGRRWLAARRAFHLPPLEPWTLALAIPMDELLAPVRQGTLALVGLLALLALVQAWRFHAIAQRFARPLADLAQAADSLAQGEVPTLPPSSVAEVHTLGQALLRAGEAVRERDHLQQQLQHSQRMETIGTLAGGIAHDVNNQLGAVLGQLDLALDHLPPGHPARIRMDRAAEAVQRCAKTTRSLLTFSHQAQPELHRLGLNDLVQETAHLLDRILGGLIRVELDLAPELPPVLADSVQMEQVLMNLAVNARDAMPQGGTLKLRTYAEGARVKLQVADTGRGIPPEVLSHIFEPFFTTKAVGKGTGLGLAMVFGIVRSHTGHISVASEVGRGATFTVDLPSADSDPGEITGFTLVEAPEGGSLAGLRILVVEDEPDLRETLADALTVARARVTPARDGEEAWILFSQMEFDVVLSDQRMPRMLGMELLRRIREKGSALPFILASGQDLEPFREDLVKDPNLRLLPKPFSIARLIEITSGFRLGISS